MWLGWERVLKLYSLILMKFGVIKYTGKPANFLLRNLEDLVNIFQISLNLAF